MIAKIYLMAIFVVMSLVKSTLSFYVARPVRNAAAVSSSRWTVIRATAEEKEGETEKEVTVPQEEEKPAKKAAASTDILNSPDFLKRKLEVIKSDIAKAEADLEAAKQRLEEGKKEWGSQINDLQKEYQNIQQRMNVQSQKSDDQATMQVARQMLEVLDNFDRAFGSVTPETDEQGAIEAEYKKAYDDILSTFKKLGVEEVQSVGTEFDYEVHQAVMQRPSDEYEEGIVCEEFQKGFKIGDTLIRAAMVAVAA
jgi:molecular chaperone GrpE